MLAGATPRAPTRGGLVLGSFTPRGRTYFTSSWPHGFLGVHVASGPFFGSTLRGQLVFGRAPVSYSLGSWICTFRYDLLDRTYRCGGPALGS